MKQVLAQIGLEININKCKLLSDDPQDYITDEKGEVLISESEAKYLDRRWITKGMTVLKWG